MNALGRGAVAVPDAGLARRAAGTLGLVLAVVLLVGGCSPDAEPSPMPTPSSPRETVASSPTPTTVPPTLPAEAKGTSPAAAKAFVRHYFDQINYAARTGDTRALRELSTDDCESCDAIASNVERIYDGGGHIADENWSVRSVDVLKASGGEATVSVGAHIGKEVIVEPDGQETVKDGGKQPMTIFLTADGESFRIARLDLVT